MKLTMTFDTQTDDEADQIMTIEALLKEQPIEPVTTIRNGLNATIADTTDEPTSATETETIAVIKAAIERLHGYEERQRVLAWVAQFAVQAGVTVS